jgi:hypothetical protein
MLLVVEHNGPTMMARIGIMRALNRHVERVFNPARKDPSWGRRKLARDRCGVFSSRAPTVSATGPSAVGDAHRIVRTSRLIEKSQANAGALLRYIADQWPASPDVIAASSSAGKYDRTAILPRGAA